MVTLPLGSGTDFAIDFVGDSVCLREIAAQTRLDMVRNWPFTALPATLVSDHTTQKCRLPRAENGDNHCRQPGKILHGK